MGTIRIILILIIASGLWATSAPAQAAELQQGGPSPCSVAIQAAIAQLGKPYVWGAKGPASFDCSGLTQWAWAAAGYNIGPSTYNQQYAGQRVACALSQMATDTCFEPGDLIFARYAGGQHVAIYIGGGRVVDAYNTGTGVISYSPAADSWWQTNYWQTRRIVDCDETPPAELPTVTNPIDSGSAEQIPPIIEAVSFRVPQCGECAPDQQTLLAPQPWSGSWPSGWELLDAGRVFQIVISWLAWQISEIIRNLICWLLTMLQILANILAAVANVGVNAANALWAGLVSIVLLLQYGFQQLIIGLGMIMVGITNMQFIADLLAEMAKYSLQLIADISLIIGRLLLLLGSMLTVALNFVGWMIGVSGGMVSAVISITTSTATPTLLQQTYPLNYAVRGVIEGIGASWLGWIYPLLWALCWIMFGIWFVGRLSKDAE
jgi:hypothetical protein